MVENCEGCSDCTCDARSTITIARNPINISPPVQCRTCEGQFYIFDCPGHPDDGEPFACGVMMENIRINGSRPFACAYRKAPALSPIIDAEQEQRKNSLYYVGKMTLDAPVFTGGLDYLKGGN